MESFPIKHEDSTKMDNKSATGRSEKEKSGPKSAAEDKFELIAQAHEEFNKTNYEKCLEILKQLEFSESNNKNKVRHNRAVVEFYQSECRNHGKLLRALNELDIVELNSDKNARQGSDIAKYNRAVIFFHRHMYRTAIDTLAPLVESFNSLEDKNTVLVSILMLRLLLATNQLSRAQSFLEHIQTQMGLNTDSLSTDGNASPINFPNIDGHQRTFKLLRMLTNVLNRRIVVVPEDDSIEFAALKAHQYYIMKDFQMAAKQLKKISTENYSEDVLTDELNTCIANNMGVIHLRVRHYAIAAKFFQNAITFDKKIASNLRNAPLHEMSAARSCEILYNMGISMLHLRRPKEAFQCFLIPLKSYHSNPRLWLRMAEACIMEYEMKLLEDDKKPFVRSVSTIGTRRRYILKHTKRIKYTSNSQSAAVPEPNLEFASLSLRNALTLTTFYKSSFYVRNEDENTESEPQTNWQNIKDNNFCNPSKPISKESLDNMLSAIFAASSYVSLRLGDYVKALEMAQELLKVEKLSDAHKMLAHMYAGEALIMMDKLGDARPYLEPTFATSLNAFDFETKDWQVKSLDAAQNIVRYNLAVAMVLQGDVDTAKTLLNTCIHPIVSSKVVSLNAYINIRVNQHS